MAHKIERFEVYRIGGRYVCVNDPDPHGEPGDLQPIVPLVSCVEIGGPHNGSKFGVPRAEFKPDNRVTGIIGDGSGKRVRTAEEIVRERTETGRAR